MKIFTKLFCALALAVAGVTSMYAQDEIKDVTDDMFFKWDGAGADANNVGEASGTEFGVGTELAAGACVCGTGSVWWHTYADLTGCSKLLFEGTAGTNLRVLMNRAEDAGNNGAWVEKNPAIGEDGKAELDLTEYAFVHINAIKIAWGSSGTITSLQYVKPSDPLAVPKDALKAVIGKAKLQTSCIRPKPAWQP